LLEFSAWLFYLLNPRIGMFAAFLTPWPPALPLHPCASAVVIHYEEALYQMYMHLYLYLTFYPALGSAQTSIRLALRARHVLSVPPALQSYFYRWSQSCKPDKKLKWAWNPNFLATATAAGASEALSSWRWTASNFLRLTNCTSASLVMLINMGGLVRAQATVSGRRYGGKITSTTSA